MAAAACHAAAVLVSNLGGATGFLLGLDGGQTASLLKVDSIFPVRGLKRCINYQQRFGEMSVLITQASLATGRKREKRAKTKTLPHTHAGQAKFRGSLCMLLLLLLLQSFSILETG